MGGSRRIRRVPELVLLAAALLLASVTVLPRARAGPALTALDPVELFADGFGDLRGLAVDGQGNLFVADRAVGAVTRIAPAGPPPPAAPGAPPAGPRLRPPGPAPRRRREGRPDRPRRGRRQSHGARRRRQAAPLARHRGGRHALRRRPAPDARYR